jgi:hypothetical protein
VGVGRVQHRVAAGRHVAHDHALEHREVFDGGDVVEPEMVAAADVGHHRHLAAIEAQALAQHAATRHFEDGRIDIRMQQHVARALRAAAVAAVGLAAVDVDAVGVGHAGAQAAAGQQMIDQPRGGRLAVGAGHGDHRDAAVVAVREQGVHDRLADRPAAAE